MKENSIKQYLTVGIILVRKVREGFSVEMIFELKCEEWISVN